MKEHGNVKEPKYLEGLEVDGSKVVNYYRDLKSKNSKHFTWWVNILCSCGNNFTAQKNKFESGKSKCNDCSMSGDIVGQSYERMTVVSKSNIQDRKYTMYDCICTCGSTFQIESRAFGRTKSCGCAIKLFSRVGINKGNTFNVKHGKSGTRVYSIWGAMIGRATNKNSPRADDYVNRGIGVCEHWLKFENFYKDMGDPPVGKSLDRIDNNKGYCKENCKWSTPSEQMSNRRSSLNTSGRIGVNFDNKTKSWKVRLTKNGIDIWLGRYKDFEEACCIMESAELEYLGYSRVEYVNY